MRCNLLRAKSEELRRNVSLVFSFKGSPTWYFFMTVIQKKDNVVQ